MPLNKQALEGCRRALGEERPNALMSLHHLATSLEARGRLEEAEPSFGLAQGAWRCTCEGRRPDTPTGLNFLAAVWRPRSRAEEAEPLLGQALKAAGAPSGRCARTPWSA